MGSFLLLATHINVRIILIIPLDPHLSSSGYINRNTKPASIRVEPIESLIQSIVYVIAIYIIIYPNRLSVDIAANEERLKPVNRQVMGLEILLPL